MYVLCVVVCTSICSAKAVSRQQPREAPWHRAHAEAEARRWTLCARSTRRRTSHIRRPGQKGARAAEHAAEQPGSDASARHTAVLEYPTAVRPLVHMHMHSVDRRGTLDPRQVSTSCCALLICTMASLFAFRAPSRSLSAARRPGPLGDWRGLSDLGAGSGVCSGWARRPSRPLRAIVSRASRRRPRERPHRSSSSGASPRA